MKIDKEKKARTIIFIIFFIIVLEIYLFPNSSNRDNLTNFYNLYLMNIVFPCLIYLAISLNLYPLPNFLIPKEKTIKITIAIFLLSILIFIDKLQYYFDVWFFDNNFDLMYYLMPFIGIMIWVFIDYLIIKFYR